jgi:hypothetical protein
MTTVIKQLDEELGSRLLRSTGDGAARVHDVVESWNWNLNIFEIYDEIKEWKDNDIRNVCKYAYHYFNKDAMFDDLAYHLTAEGIKD